MADVPDDREGAWWPYDDGTIEDLPQQPLPALLRWVVTQLNGGFYTVARDEDGRGTTLVVGQDAAVTMPAWRFIENQKRPKLAAARRHSRSSVRDDPHAGLRELLHRIARFKELTSEARYLRNDEHLKRRARLQGVHQAQKAGTLGELGTADTVIDVDVFVRLEDREILLDSPTDKFLLSAVNFASEIEREKARQRTYDAMQRKARAGHVTGGRVFGYDNVEILGPDGQRSHVERRINADGGRGRAPHLRAVCRGRGTDAHHENAERRRGASATATTRPSGGVGAEHRARGAAPSAVSGRDRLESVPQARSVGPGAAFGAVSVRMAADSRAVAANRVRRTLDKGAGAIRQPTAPLCQRWPSATGY